jgi:hypothetical protein
MSKLPPEAERLIAEVSATATQADVELLIAGFDSRGLTDAELEEFMERLADIVTELPPS